MDDTTRRTEQDTGTYVRCTVRDSIRTVQFIRVSAVASQAYEIVTALKVCYMYMYYTDKFTTCA